MPPRICACGCGELTSGGTYKVGHCKRVESVARGPLWLEQDCGYTTPCWIWQRSLSYKGYANRWDPQRQAMRAGHIVAYEEAHGPVPAGKQLDHLCRQRACVNPSHLEPVTNAENGRRGAATILSERDVHVIRSMLRDGQKGIDLAERFGVSPVTISAIKVGRLWPDVI